MGRFGTQPPHPPIFGTNVPKKRVFFRLPLRDTDSAHFKMHFRFGKLLHGTRNRRSREISMAEGVYFPISPEFWWNKVILFIIRECTG